MRMVDLIEKKRDGGVLTDDEIRFIIRGFTDGSIPDYQMSAFAMTVFYKGIGGKTKAEGWNGPAPASAASSSSNGRRAPHNQQRTAETA